MKTIFIICLLLFIFYNIFISRRSLHMLQQNRYNRGFRYIKWYLKNYKETIFNYNLIYLIFILSINNSYIYIIITIILSLIYKYKFDNKNAKLPLKYTARVKRLIFTDILIDIIICLIIYFNYNIEYLHIYYLILGIVSYFNYLIVLLCNFINKPIEKMVELYYLNKAEKKLKSMNNMEVIGITGSYGKTSTKNIVYDILSIKYNVFKTPENYNTPYGLMISINNYLDKFNDYFIAEMGACKRGDIKELCDMVYPKYGILTRVGLAHLETFGSEENIQSTKFELIESLPIDGIGILNMDDPKQVSYKINNNCKILWIGIDSKEADARATDIKLSSEGTKFNVAFKGDKNKYPFETKLLGRNNIYNILDGILLGKELGIKISDLQKSAKLIKPIEHRLSIKKYYDINIIDDAYNSNPSGAKMALEVLSMMPGKHIIVTPGMIELGNKEYELNKELGKNIAESADIAILIGKEKTKPIYDGLKESKFNKENIYVLDDVMEAFPLIRKLEEGETYVLFENDLPDSFNEKGSKN